MTPTTSCAGCFYYQPSRVYRMGCYRPRAFKDRTEKAPFEVGFSPSLETYSAYPLQDGRLIEDICGPDRRHYRGERE